MRRSISRNSLCVLICLAIMISNNTHANIEYNQNITPEVIFGSGNANGHFTTDRNNGVEVGLRAKIPTIGTLHSDGNGIYRYSLLETNHDNNSGTANQWNFDWTINTDYDNSTGQKIDEFSYELGLDADPGLGTNFLVFDPITSTVLVPFSDHSIGDNTTINGGGTEAIDEVSYLNLLSNNNVLQQSWKYEFFPFAPLDTYNPNTPGTYTIYLLVRDSLNNIVSRSEIKIIIGGIEFDQNVTPDVIFGTGNTNGNFTTDRENGIEVGLRAKIPNVGITNSNGDGSYTYTFTETDHDNIDATPKRWNFDWTINTDFDDSNGLNLDQFTYEMGLDSDPGLGVDFLVFDPVTANTPPLDQPYFDHDIGDNLTANGGGAEATNSDSYSTLLENNNVLQQSWRYSFFPITPLDTYNPDLPGTYAIYLLVRNLQGEVVARTEIQVIIRGIEHDQNVTPEVIYGSGNSNGAFTTERNQSIETSLRAKIPNVGTTNSNGDGTFSFTLAETDHDNSPGTSRRWNFDFAVNTDTTDSTGMKISDFSYELGLDVDPSLATNYFIFDPITPTEDTPFSDHSIGDNTTLNGGGTETSGANDTEKTNNYLNLISNNNVLQQSWRYAFFPFPPLDTYNPDIPGTYSIYFQVKDGLGNIVGRSDIQVLIESSPSAPNLPFVPTLAPDLTAATDTGLSNIDDLTFYNTPDFLVKCSAIGNTINLYSNIPSENTFIGNHFCTSNGIESASVSINLAQAIHSITYTDENSFGESPHSLSLDVTLDLFGPIGPGSLSAPATLTDEINDDIIGSCGSDAANGSIQVTTQPSNGFSNNYGTQIILDSNGGFTITDPNWSEGSFSIHYDCNDLAGNGPNNLGPFGPITVDLSPPMTPSCSTDPSSAKNGTFVVTTCTNVEEFSVLSIANMACLQVPTTATETVNCFGLVGLDAGDVSISNDTVTVTDLIGNSNSGATTGLLIDNTPPTTPVCSTSPNPANDGSIITTTCTSVEDTSTLTIPNMVCQPTPTNGTGMVNCTGIVGSNLGEVAVNNDVVTVTDQAANTNTNATTGLIIDNDIPVTPTCSTTPNPANNGTMVTTTCTNVEETSTLTIPNMICEPIPTTNTESVTCISNVGTAAGEVSVSDDIVTVTDSSGNINNSETTGLVIDNLAPAAPIIDPIGTSYLSIVGTAEAFTTITIAGAICTNAPVSADVNGDWICVLDTNLAEGTIVSAAATDEAGNTSSITNSTVLLANVAPSFEITCNIDATDVTGGTQMTVQIPDFIFNRLVGPISESGQSFDLQISSVADSNGIVSTMSLLNTGELILEINISNSGFATLEVTMTDNGGTTVGGVDSSSAMFDVHHYADFSLDPNYQHLDPMEIIYKNTFDPCR